MSCPYDIGARQEIFLGVHELNFRGGVFKSLIDKNTPILNSLQILIDSKHTTPAEKEVFKDGRQKYITLANLGSDADHVAGLPFSACMMKIGDIFTLDARARGVDALHGDGSVLQTTSISSGESATTTLGCIHCFHTGASEDYIKTQEHNIEQACTCEGSKAHEKKHGVKDKIVQEFKKATTSFMHASTPAEKKESLHMDGITQNLKKLNGGFM